MRYTNQVVINLPRDRVAELFDNPDNLQHWQEGLESFTHRSGELGQPGAVSDIVFQQGKRQIVMEETIESRNMPESFVAVYTTKGVWNRNENYFTKNADGTTTWRQENEFRCEGLMMKLMTTFMPGMFRKTSQKFMDAFKEFAENV